MKAENENNSDSVLTDGVTDGKQGSYLSSPLTRHTGPRDILVVELNVVHVTRLKATRTIPQVNMYLIL
jgi:hypothetical protein